MSLVDRHILLGVSGGIAAYKACELCRAMRRAGAEVRVVMTANAEHFVTATTFQALSGQPVRTSLWDASAEAAMSHIELARWAERIVIAPASADVIARLAHGHANDLLTTICLATTAPLTVAPAMNWRMWEHPATQANMATLLARGVQVLGPADGPLAEGESGPGRLLEPAAIVAALDAPPASNALDGVSVLVSAGPTFEDIDPVRFIGNRSSGRMGFAVAAAAAAAGAEVTLVAGPVSLPTPAGVTRRIDVRSAEEMHRAMQQAAAKANIVIAVAAVADYRPRQRAKTKLKRDGSDLALDLVENPDIIASLASLEPKPFLVGFAAETENLGGNAQAKLQRKQLDMIAANMVSDGQGFDHDDNALTVYWPNGSQVLPRAPKSALASDLFACIMQHYRAKLRP